MPQKGQFAFEPTRWRRSQIAETFASVRVSAPSYRFAENIGFAPIVEPELKLVQIQRQIFLPDAMVCSEHATLEQRPDRFDALRADVPRARILIGNALPRVRVSFS